MDLTVATYALFGMMNWIYNWYDPQGKLKVTDLAQHLTQLFLDGLLPEPLSISALLAFLDQRRCSRRPFGAGPRGRKHISIYQHE